VASAPDAEPADGRGYTAGVSGAAHGVAPDADHLRSARGGRLPPIRYAHSGADPAPAGPGVSGTAASGSGASWTAVAGSGASGASVSEAGAFGSAADEAFTRPVPAQASYGQTPGLVYEGQDADGGQPYGFAPYDEAEPAGQADDGLAIFGGMATTEASDDAPYRPRPYRDYGPSHPPAAASSMPGTSPGPGTPGQVTSPGPGTPGQEPAQPAGDAWNQPVTSSAGAGGGDQGARRPRPFGKRTGGRGSRNWRRGPAPGPGGSKATVRDLPPDVRMRFWRLRVALMVVVGLLFGILTRSWVIGLTLAILAGMADTGYRSWNAATYAHGAGQHGAQRRTRRQLARLRRAGYFTLDARPIPDSPEVIDHLVIGPTGVYAIDSEKWNPKLPIRTWNGKKLYHGPDSQKMRLEHAVWEAQQASEVLSAALGTEITVRPALAIYGPKIPWDIAEIRGVDVFSGGALVKYFRRRGKMRSGVPQLTREQARTIYDTASRLLPDISAGRTASPVG
jgi:hypothetical protein